MNELRKVAPVNENSERRLAIKPPPIYERRISEVKCDICMDNGSMRWAKAACSLCGKVVCEFHIIRISESYYCINCRNNEGDTSNVLRAVSNHNLSKNIGWKGFFINLRCWKSNH